MHQDLIDCMGTSAHLSSCDDDGYCNFCGHQEGSMEEYEVVLSINLAATSPEEAVNTFIKWIEEDGLRAWAYGVTNLETGAEYLYDTELEEMG